MPSPAKIHTNKSVLFITTSIEQGLLLLSNPLAKVCIKSALARAQALHRVRICAYVVEATHVHMLVVVDNPDDIKDFMDRFKTESSHAINRILGRRKRTIWCRGYDSPPVLTLSTAMRYLVYLYTNPAKDNLVDSIEEYPGLSSWKMFRSGKFEEEFSYIRRPHFRSVSDRARSPKRYAALAGELLSKAEAKLPFCITPNAWMECFGVMTESEQAKVNEILLRWIKAEEQKFRDKRCKEGKRVLGRERLLQQAFDTTYLPDRHGKRMWCLCDEVPLRKEFIAWAKELLSQARQVYERWKRGDFGVKYPPGLYPPSMPKLAEPLELW